MNEQVVMMLDLADYIKADVDKTSLRKVAKKTGVSKSTIAKIVNRQYKSERPKVDTLEKIAGAYHLTLSTVVEMAGAMMGDGGDMYVRLARELEKTPWVVERFDDLVRMTEAEFHRLMDHLAWQRLQEEDRRRRQNGDQSTQ